MSEASSTAASAGSKSQAIGDWLYAYLQKSAKVMKTVDMAMSILVGLVGLVLFFSGLILVDHWLWPLPTWARFVAWGFTWGVGAWWLVTRIVPTWLRKVQQAYVAKQIERTMPELKNSLINWLQLSNEGDGTPRGVLAAVGRHAMGQLKDHDATAVIDQAGPIRWAALLAGLLVLSSFYLALAPKSGLDTLRRILLPWESIAAPARVQFISIDPGDTSISQGSQLPVRVQLRGLRRGEIVYLQYTTADRQIVDRKIPLEPDLEGLSYKIDFGASQGGVQQAFHYRIQAGDALSREYRVDVHAVPIVLIDRVEYQYPRYTQLKPRVVQGEGRIEAIEGTQVILYGKANQPLSKGRLEIDPEVQEGRFLRASSVRDLAVSDRQVSVDWLLKLDEKRTSPTLTSYRFKISNTHGESNPDPVIYQVKILGDLPPEVRLLSELPAQVRVPINGRLDMEWKAVDPDYGLQEVRWLVKQGTQVVREESLLETLHTPSLQTSTTFLPSELGLRVGDRVEVTVTAKDNRTRPGTDEWEPNIANSRSLTIEVVAEDKNQPPTPSPSKEEANPTKPNRPQPKVKQEPEKNKRNNSSDKSNPGEQSKDSEEGSSAGVAGGGSENSKESNKDAKSKNGQGAGNASSSPPSQDNQTNSNANDGSGTPDGKVDAQSNSPPSSKGNGSNSDSSNQDPKDPLDGSPSSPNDTKNDPSQESSNANNQGKPSGKPQEITSDSQGSKNAQPINDRDIFEMIEKHRRESQSEPKQNSPSSPQESSQSNPPDKQSSSNEGASKESNPSKSDNNDSKGNDSKGSDSKGSDSKDSDTKDSDTKDSDTKDSDTKGNDSKGNDSKGNDSKGNDSKGNDSKGNDSKGSDTKGSDTKGSDTKGSDTKGNDTKGNDTKGNDSKSSDSKGSDSKGSDSKGSDSKGSDSKGSDSKGNDSKGNDSKGNDSKGNDSKGNDSKGNDSKGNDSKGNDSKGNDSKGNNTKGSDTKGSDTKGSDTKGSDTKGSDSKGNDSKGNDSKGSDSKGNDSKGNDSKGNDSKGNDSKGSDSKGNDSKGSDSKGNDSKGSDSKGSDSKGSDTKGSDSKGSDSKGSDSKGSDSKGSDSKGSDSKGSDSKGSDSKGSDSSQKNSSPGQSSNEGQASSGSNPSDKNSNNSGSEASQPSSSSGPGSSSKMQRGNESGSNSNRNSSSGSSATGPERADPASPEYAQKATDLVLDYLDRQREQPDPELLKKLRWSPEDLRAFSDRWRKAKEEAMRDPNKKRELEEALKALGFQQTSSQKRSVQTSQDDLRGMQEEGARIRPPESLREQIQAYRKALQGKNP